MIDIKKHECEEEDYKLFLRYVESTWIQFMEGDWVDEPTIEKIIVSNYKNTFQVFVYLKGNPKYYDIENGELIEVVYDGKAIKTEYSLKSHELLYVLLRGTLIEDLGLTDVELIISDYVNGIEINEDLSKELEKCEEGWAEDYYCMVHDL